MSPLGSMSLSEVIVVAAVAANRELLCKQVIKEINIPPIKMLKSRWDLWRN